MATTAAVVVSSLIRSSRRWRAEHARANSALSGYALVNAGACGSEDAGVLRRSATPTLSAAGSPRQAQGAPACSPGLGATSAAEQEVLGLAVGRTGGCAARLCAL